MTVREICTVLDIGDGIKSEVELAFGASAVKFNPINDLEMLAYGDFIIDSCHVWEGGVNLVLKQQFCRKTA